VLGNLVPAFVWLIPAAAGLFIMASTRHLLGTGLWLLGASTVLGWLALDTFGFFENAQMRKEVEKILTGRKEAPIAGSPFVGFATPKYHGLLDAHEDVGFLQILPDRLTFVSETRKVEVLSKEVRRIRYRPNIHTLLLLGRWVSVEGESGGKPIRLLVEPRERSTMLGNFRESSRLRDRLAKWAKTSGSGSPAA
jgi:hypothetical protein